jgi:hypothetical protein
MIANSRDLDRRTDHQIALAAPFGKSVLSLGNAALQG